MACAALALKILLSINNLQSANTIFSCLIPMPSNPIPVRLTCRPHSLRHSAQKPGSFDLTLCVFSLFHPTNIDIGAFSPHLANTHGGVAGAEPTQRG